MFKRLLIFCAFYFLGFLGLLFMSKGTNLFHFSATVYIIAFFLGLWEERVENRIMDNDEEA